MQNNLFQVKKSIINETKLIDQYYNLSPDPYNNKEHKVFFGTSGHRGSSYQYSFNEAHVFAISQSIVQIRTLYGITGPCYVAKDTHTLSEPAFISVLEVLTANSINVIIEKNDLYTPTPVISNAIINYNRHRYHNNQSKADGIIVTSSHNPPEDGGIKYSSIFGGPAEIDITYLIEKYANRFLLNNLRTVNKITLNHAWRSGYIHPQDLVQNYVQNLSTIINMKAIQKSGLKIGVDPLSGSSINCWYDIAQYYQLNLTVINSKIDRTFSFMNIDYDGRIRINCTSELTLSRVLSSSKKFDLFFINDPDCDRHGIITKGGLIQSNYYFPIVINYLFHNRDFWKKKILSVGKTNVSSMSIDQVANNLNCQLLTTPVGFKWFTQGLLHSKLGFAGEDSSGASFLDQRCMPWSTDKDGFIMCLISAEILAVTDHTLQDHHIQFNKNLNCTFNYNQTYLVINHSQKKSIINTLFNQIHMNELVGDPIIKVENIKPLNKFISMDGLKIVTRNGWIAGRLSGTELVYKIYCESFLSSDHRLKMEQKMIRCIYQIIN